MKGMIDVVGAVIVADGRVLAAQRGPGKAQAGLWEFPGGKVEDGEDAAHALRREIAEELRCDITVGAHVETTTHLYGDFAVTLTTYYCTLGVGETGATGEPEASEHAELRWMDPAELSALDWAPADLPAVQRVMQDLAR